MSEKKEKRIKRLRKYSLWPQIIETILVEVAFIVAVVLIIACLLLSGKPKNNDKNDSEKK